jgi:biopolymer transport protein ExbD
MSMSVPSGDDDDGEVPPEMNTTPLIDVMLVLLVMLIITIPIQTHAVKLDMPTNTASPATEPPKVIEIAVSQAGAITWDGNYVGTSTSGRAALDAKISEAANVEPQPEVHVRPDAQAKYEVVAMVMASLQRLGLTKIGLTGNEQFVDY